MKHVFIINPAAGKENSFEIIKSELEALETSVTYELYETKAPGDATAYIHDYCRKHHCNIPPDVPKANIFLLISFLLSPLFYKFSFF